MKATSAVCGLLSWVWIGLLTSAPLAALSEDGPLRVGTFAIDATPPVGSPLAYDTMEGVDSALECRGIVIAGAGKPIVLATLDWIKLANGGHRAFQEALAEAVGTEVDRVSVHSLHQHDAPRCDFDAEALLAESGQSGIGFNPGHARAVVEKAARAAAEALKQARPVTSIGHGKAVVDRVASNRRILGPDGKVAQVRFTSTKDAKLREAPTGVVDPELKLVAFLDGDEPLAVLTYFATHPQSYYRTKQATVDFPGMARNQREKETGAPHLHFTGAAGNVGAGKWNRGTPEDRLALTERMRTAMQAAWDGMERTPVGPGEIGWAVERVSLPVSPALQEVVLQEAMVNRVDPPFRRFLAAGKLTWLRRCERGDTISIGCLSLGGIRILHLPGEPFVEYQLAAQAMRPDRFVAMAGYGDGAPGYIGTEVAYGQGGYETGSPSNVSPRVEEVLMGAMRKLLDGEE